MLMMMNPCADDDVDDAIINDDMNFLMMIWKNATIMVKNIYIHIFCCLTEFSIKNTGIERSFRTGTQAAVSGFSRVSRLLVVTVVSILNSNFCL